MSDLKAMAAQAALHKMLADGYLSICTIDKIIKMLSISADAEAYSLLSTLHCVHYNQMPAALLEELPTLIMRVLNSPRLEASRLNIVTSGGAIRLVKN